MKRCCWGFPQHLTLLTELLQLPLRPCIQPGQVVLILPLKHFSSLTVMARTQPLSDPPPHLPVSPASNPLADWPFGLHSLSPLLCNSPVVPTARRSGRNYFTPRNLPSLWPVLWPQPAAGTPSSTCLILGSLCLPALNHLANSAYSTGIFLSLGKAPPCSLPPLYPFSRESVHTSFIGVITILVSPFTFLLSSIRMKAAWDRNLI